jgi:hypothetical protein
LALGVELIVELSVELQGGQARIHAAHFNQLGVLALLYQTTVL